MSRVAIIQAFVGLNDELMLADMDTVGSENVLMAVSVERNARSFCRGESSVLLCQLYTVPHIYSHRAPRQT